MSNSARIALLALIPCFMFGPAEAVDAVEPADSSAVSLVPAAERIPGIKSGTTAFLWSFLGTAVPAAAGSYDVYRAESSDSEVPGIVLVSALVVGPSLGHFYAGRNGRALVGIGIRTVAGAAVAASAIDILDDSNENRFELLGVAGLVLGGASLVWDILDAPHSAHVHNEHLRQARALRVTPTMGPGLGLRADLSF